MASTGAKSLLRSHTATGASGILPDASTHRAWATTAPVARARSPSAAARCVLPTPGAPESTSRPPRPARVSSQHCRSTAISRARPIGGRPAPRPGASDAGGRRAAGSQQVAGLGRRGHAEFALEHGGAAVEGVQRGRPVPEGQVGADQSPVAGLLQRLDGDALPGHRQGAPALPQRGPRRDGVVAQRGAFAADPLPRRGHPVRVVAGHQIPAVLVQGQLRVGQEFPRSGFVRRRQGGLAFRGEHLHIDAQPRSGQPADGPVGGRKAVDALQQLPQVVQFPAEVCHGLALGGVGPKRPGQHRARHADPGVQDKIGQQLHRPGPAGNKVNAQRRETLFTEQIQLQHGPCPFWRLAPAWNSPTARPGQAMSDRPRLTRMDR